MKKAATERNIPDNRGLETKEPKSTLFAKQTRVKQFFDSLWIQWLASNPGSLMAGRNALDYVQT